jgi:septum formation protein
VLYLKDQPEGSGIRLKEIILASSSPRRQELLAQMGVPFRVFVPQVEEDILSSAPVTIVQTLAQRKAHAVGKVFPNAVILAADTVVFAQGNVLGKPRDVADAARMLQMLSNTWHEVYTGVCMTKSGFEQIAYAVTRVCFSFMSPTDIAYYCASGEPMGKAGAYAIQGLGGMYIEEIQGNYANVVGLPTNLVRRMLLAFDDL